MPPQPVNPEEDAVREVPAVPPARRSASRTARGRTGASRRRRCGARSTCATATRRSSTRWTRAASGACSTTLVNMGFKEIEVGFPSASQPDFDFVRQLIEEDLIPDDVTIQVLTQCRPELIERTYECLQGRRARPSSTSTTRRRSCSAASCSASTRPASPTSRSTPPSCAASSSRRMAGTDVRYEYSPESFTGTELDYARRDLRGGDGRHRADPRPADHPQPAGDGRDVHAQHLRATSSSGSTAHVPNRDSVVLSLHPHNDRGCAVAAAEFGVMAGADRVEGTLFGNGERTGNVDVVNLAMNLFARASTPSSTSPTSTRCAAWPSTATACRCTRATPTSATSSTRRSPARTRTPSRRASTPCPRTTRRGRCRTCPSTRSTSGAPTRPSSGSTASRARAAWPTS